MASTLADNSSRTLPASGRKREQEIRLFASTRRYDCKRLHIDDTAAERQRMERMCDTSPCTMEGPLRFTLGLKDGTKHTFEAGPGERMRVEMVGTRVRCSDL